MPTNILRKQADAARPARRAAASGVRRALLTVGTVSIRIELSPTDTADRVWAALPLYSTAETWGGSVHFETLVETGRDRTARINATPGEIYFWIDEDRIIVPFGPTPISRPTECRLPSPCNVWAIALDDVATLKAVLPGQKVALVAA